MIKNSLYDRLWRRECGDRPPHVGLRGIYGSREWVNDLDIVNELGGHTGCINALSWSRSGRLLASGSDDQHVNIYLYQPESHNAPFTLNTTVATGHRQNIFSVKFMPHSNDHTLVTCAGDSQVRVFDIEHSSSHGNTAATSAFAASARSQRFNNFFDGARYLNEGNTNARVYRSHADRVKRIVTESSPHLFLTCSEDGEVRQWDLRQPSSAYPPPRGGQGFMAYRPGLEHDDTNVPPPLISYKRFNLDLNTISCSPTQPHYIALGGAHMHCFLHDRRMLGRDMLNERGSPVSLTPSATSLDDEKMGKATRCVRRFAPRGKRRMKHLDDGHITACKISDANPNEMVVSWSGDHIYSFDLIRSPDAGEALSDTNWNSGSSNRTRKDISRCRKRKRPKPSSSSSQDSSDRHHSQRQSNGSNGESSGLAFLGLGEELNSSEGILEHARYSILNEAQRLSMDIAKGLVKLRQALFSPSAASREANEMSEPSSYSESFASVLLLASTCLPQMDDVIRRWRYPMNPSRETVAFQQLLRRNRQSSWRFVQAAGTLAHALDERSYNIREPVSESSLSFLRITPAPNEDESIERAAQFGYDFLKAILLWLRGGRQEVLAGFKRGSSPRRLAGRFPIPADAGEEAIENILIPYLQNLASDTPVVNVDASRFEYDSTRILFQTQRAAVTAFGNAVRLPLEDVGDTAAQIDDSPVCDSTSQTPSTNRETATHFWILRVGRGVLMEAGNGVNYSFVNRAFGGLHLDADQSDSDQDMERSQDDINPYVDDEPVRITNLMGASGSSREHILERSSTSSTENSLIEGQIRNLGDNDDEEGSANEDDNESGWHTGSAESSDEEYEDEGEESDEESFPLHFGARKSRQAHVEMDTPCSPHTRSYRGHCNIKTVKDVNYFGLDDEYVVSGSDSGHLFIWDRKTTDLVNILAGDSDVVNVIQGHPYEPTLAVSGIDSTIKIFSPDRCAQENARRGINILDPDNPANVLGSTFSNVGGLQTRRCIEDSYRIMSQNDVERRGGVSDANITRSMLSRLASSLRGRQGFGGGLGDLDPDVVGDGATIILDENCQIM